MTLPLAFDILQSGVRLSLICAVVGLGCAFVLIAVILRASPGNERMRQISGAVQEGAKAYLNRQVMTISVIAVVIFLLLFFFKDHSTAFGFLLGAFCSLAAGYIGMRIAVVANARVTQAAASQTRTAALRVAFNGGAVTGLLVVGLALLAVGTFYHFARNMIGNDLAVRSLVGLALGASLISVFARLGGGIYTKAADVGADLVGKIESGLEEDDPRNPATIADNVGDNVGDCAGMAADVFETYAVSLIGAILVGVLTVSNAPAAIVYPSVLGGISVLGAICGILFVNFGGGKPAGVLMGAVGMSALVSAILFWPATHQLFPNGVEIAGKMRSPTDLYFGPLTDNAGGIAVMSNLPKEVRAATDELDAVGNTMKAVTKGYAIASAGLAALVLFGSYVEELRAHITSSGKTYDFQFSLTEPKVIIGLFIGGLLPFIFTAFSMDAVGKAAGAVVREVRRQIQAKPGILTGADTPDYGTCVDIVTKAALREMIVPALLPLAFVILVAVIPQLGPVVLGGVLVGPIVTGLFVAIAMTSGGGAWDNAKKYIEEGNYGGKGSPAHAAAVTGDTVGDPYKDTAGPAINPMIKVVNIVAILIIPIFF